MCKKFQVSLQLDVRQFNGKKFKVIADTIRSGIKNEHGFKALKGITDSRLKAWPIVVRFATKKNRQRFENVVMQILRPSVLSQIDIKHLIPRGSVVKPVRMAVGQ
jgi:hypothetical protein